MIELNEDTKLILGMPNFRCGVLARVLRLDGIEIPQKAEEEQAYVIHWLLSFYEKHGDKWVDRVDKEMAQMARRRASNPSGQE